MGRLGETIAARFLTRQGLDVIASNVSVGKGELDLLALDRGQRVAIEVRTTSEGRVPIASTFDPINAIGQQKRRRVRSLASRASAQRIDFLGVRVGGDDILVHWVPGEV